MTSRLAHFVENPQSGLGKKNIISSRGIISDQAATHGGATRPAVRTVWPSPNYTGEPVFFQIQSLKYLSTEVNGINSQSELIPRLELEQPAEQLQPALPALKRKILRGDARAAPLLGLARVGDGGCWFDWHRALSNVPRRRIMRSAP